MTEHIDGLDALNKKLAALKDKKAVNRRAKSASRKAMQLVLFVAKSGASQIDDRSTKSRIVDNIVLKTGKSRDVGYVLMRIGVLGGGEFWRQHRNMLRKSRLTGRMKKMPNPYHTEVENDTRHWWLVEFGTSDTPAQSFMRPALKENTDRVTGEFVKVFSKSIENGVAKGKIE